jgi:hypothetical protein
MSEYFQRVPLGINHNWEATIRASKKMMSLESHAKSLGIYPPGAGELGSEHFDLKSFGIISKNYKSPKWYRLAGPFISRSMEPWLSVMLKEMQSLGPDEGAISFLLTDGDEHVDQPKDLSALNYIFSNTDPEAYTYVGENGVYGSYPSIVGEAWILDATISHGIKNSGERWALSIHFAAPYQDLKSWFDRRNAEQLMF